MEKKIPPTQQIRLLLHSPEPCARDGRGSIPAHSRRLRRAGSEQRDAALAHRATAPLRLTHSPGALLEVKPERHGWRKTVYKKLI